MPRPRPAWDRAERVKDSGVTASRRSRPRRTGATPPRPKLCVWPCPWAERWQVDGAHPGARWQPTVVARPRCDGGGCDAAGSRELFRLDPGDGQLRMAGLNSLLRRWRAVAGSSARAAARLMVVVWRRRGSRLVQPTLDPRTPQRTGCTWRCPRRQGLRAGAHVGGELVYGEARVLTASGLGPARARRPCPGVRCSPRRRVAHRRRVDAGARQDEWVRGARSGSGQSCGAHRRGASVRTERARAGVGGGRPDPSGARLRCRNLSARAIRRLMPSSSCSAADPGGLLGFHRLGINRYPDVDAPFREPSALRSRGARRRESWRPRSPD